MKIEISSQNKQNLDYTKDEDYRRCQETPKYLMNTKSKHVNNFRHVQKIRNFYK